MLKSFIKEKFSVFQKFKNEMQYKSDISFFKEVKKIYEK